MKYLVISVFLAGGIVPASAIADSSVVLKVSARILPKPCVYPQRCVSSTNPVPAAATRVVISPEKVSYVGSPPTIEKTKETLVIRF